MLILDSTSKVISIVLGGAVNAAELNVVTSWVDITTTTYTPSSFATLTNSATPVTIVAAPGASTQREVKLITVQNTDNAPATVTLRFFDGASTFKVIVVTLSVGETLIYTDLLGFKVLDTTGAIKGTGPTGATGQQGPRGSGMIVEDQYENEPFITSSATGGSAPMPAVVYSAAANEPPATIFATLDTRNSHLVLDFDGATDEEAVFSGVLPLSYKGNGLTVSTWWSFTSATSGSLRVQAAFERIDLSSLDIDADSFASFNSAGGTAPGTSGQVIQVDIAFTDGSQMDSLLAGEAFRLKIRRDADGTSGTDDITTDAELLRVRIRET